MYQMVMFCFNSLYLIIFTCKSIVYLMIDNLRCQMTILVCKSLSRLVICASQCYQLSL